MPQIACVLRTMGTARPPLPPYVLNGKSIREIFWEGSKEVIDLAIDDSRIGQPLAPALQSVNTRDLHLGLKEATGNLKYSRPIQKIGVIYAGKFLGGPANLRVLGLMFDRGFSTDDDSNQDFMTIPREGCAVFVDTIQEARSGEKAQRAETLFSTVHELGHVFNLEHNLVTPNFMANSPAVVGPDQGYYQFTDTHKSYLAECARDCIMPGGTKYGDRAEIHESFDPETAGNMIRKNPASPLQLRIHMERDSFWYCEPVELKITVKLKDGARSSKKIPNRLDPGYEGFCIWIEEPGGRRRPYRSPKFFCALPSYLVVKPGEPVVRDISIFGEAGGYTFDRTGVHKIWVTFDTLQGQIVSNVLECELREPLERLKDFQKLLPLLIRGGKALYYRSGPVKKNEVSALEEIVKKHPRSHSSAMSLHALGMLFSNQALRSKGGQKRNLDQKAIGLLKRAQDHSQLDSHRALKSSERLQAISRDGIGSNIRSNKTKKRTKQ